MGYMLIHLRPIRLPSLMRAEHLPSRTADRSKRLRYNKHMANPNVLADVSSIGQDAVVVLGAVAAGAAIIVSALAVFGVHVDQAQLVQEAGALGAAVTLVRTVIDSLASKGNAATLETPAPVASTPIAAGTPAATV